MATSVHYDGSALEFHNTKEISTPQPQYTVKSEHYGGSVVRFLRGPLADQTRICDTFPSMQSAVDLVLVHTTKDGHTFVKLVQRGPTTQPANEAGKFAIPGGFMQIDLLTGGKELPKEAAIREYIEETGDTSPPSDIFLVTVATPRQATPAKPAYTDPKTGFQHPPTPAHPGVIRDSRRAISSFIFAARASEEAYLRTSKTLDPEEISNVQWVNVADIFSGEKDIQIAFDHRNLIINAINFLDKYEQAPLETQLFVHHAQALLLNHQPRPE